MFSKGGMLNQNQCNQELYRLKLLIQIKDQNQGLIKVVIKKDSSVSPH